MHWLILAKSIQAYRIMKLVNLSKKGDEYVARAVISFKVLGISLSSNVKEFTRPVTEENWYDTKGNKLSEKKKMILDKWLRDHQRFLEKS